MHTYVKAKNFNVKNYFYVTRLFREYNINHCRLAIYKCNSY